MQIKEKNLVEAALAVPLCVNPFTFLLKQLYLQMPIAMIYW